MTTYSVLLPFTPVRPEQVVPFAALVQRTPGARLWTSQQLTLEPHQLFAYSAGIGLRVPVGTAVTLMPLRHPVEAALQARSLAQITGHPVVAGYGPGAAVFQEALLGAAYPSPLTAVREYMSAVRGLLAGERVQMDGAYFRMDASLPQVPHPPVELGLGVLRPRMARVCGEVADVAIGWLTPPDYLASVIAPELRAGAEAVSRPTPRLVAVVHVALAGPHRDPVALAYSVCARHLRGPHYTQMLRRAGVGVDPSDPVDGARRLVEAGLFLSGEPEAIAEGLAAYGKAGVDEVVLNCSAVGINYGERAALEEIETLLKAVTA
ncbi:LLM class flavin-dependent oxidoreductase [Streptomyces noursei]|nr:flavin-dependent oxidoreductase, F420-dependent methylene-tetrahydromethanopterin reductase [Streptomyces noursei ATCC 11455]MCZ0994912.1 LLM class flavin-dependent oxidoreductase [Streptomyces noursei]